MQLVARRQFLGLGLAPLAAAVFQQPEPGAPLLPFLELDHVSIRVSDVRRSAQFYMRLFGSDAARDMNRQANPGSQPGELWFIRLGRSHLALAPSFAKETPGIDHYCLSISGFSKATAQATLARFAQPFPEWPSNNVWLEDPDGLLVQLAPSANEPQIPGIVRNAAPVPRSADLPETPPFQAIRISQLSLATGRAAAARSYYRRLLGHAEASGFYRVGPSAVAVEQGGRSSFRIAVEGFDVSKVRDTVSSMGVTVEPSSYPQVVRLLDPDGLAFEIAAGPRQGARVAPAGVDIEGNLHV